MPRKKNKMASTREDIYNLVTECFLTHNEAILVELIYRLEKEYVDLAQLATMGEYKGGWTHEEVLNYITMNT
jgi:hypothetical protein